jgi:uncharacterized protein YjiS (DUF1127 family)
MTDIAHHYVINFQARTVLPQLSATVKLWRQRIREREQLAHLDARELHDLGLSRGDIIDELRKPFWRG